MAGDTCTTATAERIGNDLEKRVIPPPDNGSHSGTAARHAELRRRGIRIANLLGELGA